ncbi:MAG: glycoside hydrolase family 3 C-terminal domain-containing protein [Bacteroidota bacterium]
MNNYLHLAKSLIQQMKLEEKVSLLSGKDFWTTEPIERIGLPAIWMADGPHGLRKTPLGGIGHSEPATCFPTASALAASWDRELLYKVGEALGKESQAQGVQVLLGPGANMKRSPLGGRNFEYYSEDPILSGEMAAAFVNGVQAQGVGTSLKHFTANNQEFERMMNSSNLDERTLREIYLPAFEIAVKKAQPWTIMAAYNRVNGTFCTENSYLLTTVLRGEFGFEGVVVSDWAAVYDRVAALEAGLNLEMPANRFFDDQVKEAITSGQLSEAVLDQQLEALVALILKGHALKEESATFDQIAHHQLAVEAAAKTAVLLKNDNKVLPISGKEVKKIAVIGLNAKKPRYQGAGSSQVIPTQLDNAWEAFKTLAPQHEFTYAPGYQEKDETDPQLIQEAITIAQQAEVAVLFVGLPPDYESEGWDREHMRMPAQQLELIAAVAKVQPNCVCVLTNGSAIEMPWVHHVPAILESWLHGQGGATAAVQILLGLVNPSGKLSETFPLRLEDTPAYLSFPGADRQVDYTEGIFNGYRFYDGRKMAVLFPFGHGLSYTQFAYEALELEKETISNTENVRLRVKLKNIGDRAGAEVVQLYVQPNQSRLARPIQELKQFGKLYLEAGESAWLELNLTPRDFAYYDPAQADWLVETGSYELLIGTSSRSIQLRQTLQIWSDQENLPIIDRYTQLGDIRKLPHAKAISDEFLRILNVDPDDLDGSDAGMVGIALSIPISKLVNFTQGKFSERMLQDLIHQLNNPE